MREFRRWSCLTWGIGEGFSEEVALDVDVAKWSTEEGARMCSDPQGSTELVLNEDRREARLVYGSEEGRTQMRWKVQGPHSAGLRKPQRTRWTLSRGLWEAMEGFEQGVT